MPPDASLDLETYDNKDTPPLAWRCESDDEDSYEDDKTDNSEHGFDTDEDINNDINQRQIQMTTQATRLCSPTQGMVHAEPPTTTPPLYHTPLVPVQTIAANPSITYAPIQGLRPCQPCGQHILENHYICHS